MNTPGVTARFYRALLEQPVAIVAVVLTIAGFAAWHTRDFKFDASAETLVVEDDPALHYYEATLDKFGESSFVVLTYTPLKGLLFTQEHLDHLGRLQTAVDNLDGVKETRSILDAPLLMSPPVALAQMTDGFHTLRAGTGDLKLAAIELPGSELFRDWLVSTDGNTAMVIAWLDDDPERTKVQRRRDILRKTNKLDAVASLELRQLELAYRSLDAGYKDKRAHVIENIRAIRKSYRQIAVVYLGGVPMIAADMISYVRDDTLMFGTAIVLLIAASLWVFFRLARWVILPLITTAIAVVLTTGVLGLLGQAVTVVSSSFISLVAIITISFSVHLIVRYRELRVGHPDDTQTDLVMSAVASKTAPCLYTAATTIVAFSSLLTSGIRPVADFGWMMCLGVLISFIATFAFFPSALVLLGKGVPSPTLGQTPGVTAFLRDLTLSAPNRLLRAGAVLAAVSVFGLLLLNLDNRFVNYFKDGTEIREGMLFLDRELGGTVPLDIIINFEPYDSTPPEDDFFETSTPDRYPEKYWFSADKLRQVDQLQAYLESRPEIGKVMSVAALERAARPLNDGKPLDDLQLMGVLEFFPQDMREVFITPYASPSSGLMRLNARIRETAETLDREALIADIYEFTSSELGLKRDQVHMTGMMVLFNDMLRQMIRSQASTVGFVIIATFLMFAILLRSVKLGLIGIAPNIIAPLAVLGFMGFAGIPLDMMTTIIGAVVIGIGVDDAIHYLHRFKSERENGASTADAIRHAHDSIGVAMYFTTLAIIFGFSVLALSNFTPTVYFGVLTALAMGLALLVNLTVLPALLLKVYGDKRGGER